ncbi:SDR family oxidoreductase [Altererythrobacter aquiaggeris]|uniref:SDR family oxidoreductase n=1 Tax=Aestuarierythrobacter aquiaggeris TaxID=1898396 RepID=UPI00301A0DFD
MNSEGKRVCLIMGAGAGLGSSLARAFAAEGLAVCITRRERNLPELEALAAEIGSDGGEAHAFGVDARDEDAVMALVGRIERDIGPLELVIFNIGANVRFPVRDTTARVYRKVWEMAAFAGFLTGREAARVMVPRGQGTIIFTGATASVRGSAGFGAFAGAKHALRALAQSMARELGPQGVHVAHTIIDGLMDGKFARENFPDAAQRAASDKILSPDAVAQAYVNLWKQPRSAWTHELDMRPWTENF